MNVVEVENPIRVWLDDLRPEPVGWTRTQTAAATINLLIEGRVTHLSLDHDLGEDGCGARRPHGSPGTGYDVLNWIEGMVALHHWVPPAFIEIHSENPWGRSRMEAALASIRKLANGDCRQEKEPR